MHLTKKFTKNKIPLILFFLIILGAFFRFWHLDFGLPYNFHNDEAELVEPAITGALEFKEILATKNYIKFAPSSYVYGTVTQYLLTPFLFISKQFLGEGFVKADLYLLSRNLIATLSLITIPVAFYLYKKLFDDETGALITAFLVAVNWKLIVFSHFVNTDIILTILTFVLFTVAWNYHKKTSLKNSAILGIIFGLIIGTKITGALSGLALGYLFLIKKDLKGFLIFSTITLVAFGITNPFSIINLDQFTNRIIQMKTREAGLVFSSADTSPLKYVGAIGYITTPIIFFFGLWGLLKIFMKNINNKPQKDSIINFHIFLVLNVATYLIFFSLGERRTDRWMLPIILPIILYGAYGIMYFIKKRWQRYKGFSIIALLTITALVLYFPITLLFQFETLIPKSEAYLWAKQNLPQESKKLVVTESGNSYFANLDNTGIYKFNVYESRNAQNNFPPSTEMFDYIIVASKPMLNFKNPVIKTRYPDYSAAWQEFENNLNNSENFETVAKFEQIKPNIITLSNITVYKNLH